MAIVVTVHRRRGRSRRPPDATAVLRRQWRSAATQVERHLVTEAKLTLASIATGVRMERHLPESDSSRRTVEIDPYVPPIGSESLRHADHLRPRRRMAKRIRRSGGELFMEVEWENPTLAIDEGLDRSRESVRDDLNESNRSIDAMELVVSEVSVFRTDDQLLDDEARSDQRVRPLSADVTELRSKPNIEVDDCLTQIELRHIRYYSDRSGVMGRLQHECIWQANRSEVLCTVEHGMDDVQVLGADKFGHMVSNAKLVDEARLQRCLIEQLEPLDAVIESDWVGEFWKSA
jgi:hypothetical protein